MVLGWAVLAIVKVRFGKVGMFGLGWTGLTSMLGLNRSILG